MKAHNVPRDGNCLFSAVAFTYASHKKKSCIGEQLATESIHLRKRTMDYICPNDIPNMNAFIDGLRLCDLIETQSTESVAEYCRRMRKSGEWGSVIEIIAMTKLLQVGILVHTCFGVEMYGTEYKDRLHISLKNEHYTALVPYRQSHQIIGIVALISIWSALSL
jgi:hypothetical protein